MADHFAHRTITVAAGGVLPLAITGRSFLCTSLDAPLNVAFDQDQPTPLLQGLLLNFPTGFSRLQFQNPGAAPATVSFYSGLAWLTLAPVGVNQIVTG